MNRHASTEITMAKDRLARDADSVTTTVRTVPSKTGAMTRVARTIAIITMAAGLTACAMNHVEMPSFSSGAQSNLSRKNFRVMRTNVRGVSHGFALFGPIPIVSPTISNAMGDLHDQIGAQGKAITLVNVAQDRSTTYLILSSVPTLTVSADAIEFIDEPDRAARMESAPPAPLVAAPIASAPTRAPAPAPAQTSASMDRAAAFGKARMEIIDVREIPGTERGRITVQGMVVNRGTKPTSQVSVKVNGLDDNGARLLSVYAVPSTDVIPPNGGTATFTATLDDHPSVTRYHVEAVGM